ncbi:hypothetical protein BJX96DRAFT_26773 [Aspergillus floccosus]
MIVLFLRLFRVRISTVERSRELHRHWIFLGLWVIWGFFFLDGTVASNVPCDFDLTLSLVSRCMHSFSSSFFRCLTASFAPFNLFIINPVTRDSTDEGFYRHHMLATTLFIGVPCGPRTPLAGASAGLIFHLIWVADFLFLIGIPERFSGPHLLPAVNTYISPLLFQTTAMSPGGVLAIYLLTSKESIRDFLG